MVFCFRTHSKILWLALLFIGSSFCPNAHAQDRRPSYPYITGDGFRSISDFYYDETSRSLDPSRVFAGSVIFVKTDYLNEFFTSIHPKILCPYILITHNSDSPVPGGYADFFEDPKLIAWFGQNVEGYTHPKLVPIPIGLENRYNSHGNPDLVTKGIKMYRDLPRKYLLYMNFSIGTYPSERGPLCQMFEKVSYCRRSFPKGYNSYLSDLSQSKFVLAPRGNGLDTHRAWESLYLGAFPIVRSSAMDSVFEGLPVLIISDWGVLNEVFLLQKYEEIKKDGYSLEKLQMQYWEGVIRSLSNQWQNKKGS